MGKSRKVIEFKTWNFPARKSLENVSVPENGGKVTDKWDAAVLEISSWKVHHSESEWKYFFFYESVMPSMQLHWCHELLLGVFGKLLLVQILSWKRWNFWYSLTLGSLGKIQCCMNPGCFHLYLSPAAHLNNVFSLPGLETMDNRTSRWVTIQSLCFECRRHLSWSIRGLPSPIYKDS